MDNTKLQVLILGLIVSSWYSCSQSNPSRLKEARILTSGFIYETAPFPSCHASTIAETDRGMIAAWFGGTYERHPDVCIYISHKEGNAWSNPELVADGIINDTLRYPCWNPVLFRRDNGDIVLFYKVGPNPMEWWGMFKISADQGKSWSEAFPIPDNLLGPIKNKPVRLPDGTLLYPTSYETKEHWNIYVETSDQDLKNWRKTAIDNNGFNAIQPSVLFHAGGKLQMLCRSKESHIVETWSDDQGKTWEKVQATQLPNNNSGTDAVTCSNGLQLLVYNPVTKGRNKLALAASQDGRTWQDLLLLEDHQEGEYSYPAIVEGKDGVIHITYTYERKKIKYVNLELIYD